MVEADYDELLEFERSERYDERQKTALLYTSMLMWNPDGVDDALWERVRAHFSEPEILELGYFVAMAFGGQSVLRTMGVGHGELTPDMTAEPTHARER